MKTRPLLRQRGDHVCEVCGLEFANNAHHRKNKSQGGQDDLSNLLLLCGSGTTGCHGWITEHPAEAYAKGWSVRSTDDPADVPVLYRGSWIRLDDLGNVHPAEPIGA
ncbi:HNH endonuclease [Mycobacterium malmoense]|uniref:HNH endonuclease n=1 Tax=Mycobacterium malmoense TaxID=1780 RepID=UPI0009F2ACEE|nr:HNH endonuclease signature motif containing protein [Mycobacterium malmoense]